MSKLLLFFLFATLFTLSVSGTMMSGPKCSEFCPGFCKGKCTGNAAKPSCDGEKCHCGCPASAVDCKEDECKDFCEKHSGGRVFKSVCMRAYVCKCNFGDPTKENDMNPMPYPITSDVRAEVKIIPEA
ncbi:hypothetical protein M3Y97_00164800 [Aphelenchoides bicaudatus]|nr:hypothetical protein M3Y97_00164800 [Aphelenchoides bicaudatus]